MLQNFLRPRLELELLCDNEIQAFNRNIKKALRGQSRSDNSRILGTILASRIISSAN